MNLDPVALELANLRKQVQLLRAELLRYKEGGVILEPVKANGVPKVDLPKPVPAEKGNLELEEQIKKLKEENAKLTKENARQIGFACLTHQSGSQIS